MHPFLRRALKGAHRAAGPFLPAHLLARPYPGVPGRIHVDDLMLRSENDIRWYVDGGRSALHNIAASLAAAGRTFADVASCLDMPSGYGRVTRHLVARIPPPYVTACDADRQAVRFCASEFGVKPLFCDRDPRRLRFPETYDLIFAGSLLTHLPADIGLALLGALGAALGPRGVLVFSTQGESCLRNLAWYGAEFVEAEPAFREGLAHDGVCFVPYRRKHLASAQSPTDGAYGITLHAEGYLRAALARLGLTPIRLSTRGLESHQDVWSALGS